MSARSKSVVSVLILVAMCMAAPAGAGELKASLAMMPIYAESPEKGILVDLTKALMAASGQTIAFQVVPFKRSMNDVITRAVDFHMPLIQNPADDEAKLDYDHSTATIFHVNFTLYTNKNKPVNRNNITAYQIETDAAHVQYFHQNIIASPNIESSLKKVNAGRIDGFIFADMACDPIVKSLGLTNIKRELFQVFDVKIILPKGERGKEVDKMLSAAIDKLKAGGEFQKIMGPIDMPFENWQP